MTVGTSGSCRTFPSMGHYRFYELDPSDHIMAGYSVECGSTPTRCARLAHSWNGRPGRSLEEHQLRRPPERGGPVALGPLAGRLDRPGLARSCCCSTCGGSTTEIYRPGECRSSRTLGRVWALVLQAGAGGDRVPARTEFGCRYRRLSAPSSSAVVTGDAAPGPLRQWQFAARLRGPSRTAVARRAGVA